MFISHLIADQSLPEKVSPYVLYEYIVAKNGVFVRAARHGLRATVCISRHEQPIRGLNEMHESIGLDTEPVPAGVLASVVRSACAVKGMEVLYYLFPLPWKAFTPEQVATPGSVRPSDPYDPTMRSSLIEVHSHHAMKPFFSAADDLDEKTGFRLYTVIGNLAGHPAILTRVGIYGYFRIVPSAAVYEMPPGLTDWYSKGITKNEHYQY